MTSIEQSMVAAGLFVAMIIIGLYYPHERDLSASTRAMLHGSFEGRTIISSPDFQPKRQNAEGGSV